MLKKGLGLLIALLLCMQTVAFSATDISQLEEDKSETESKLEQLEKDKEENQKDIEEKEARQEELMAQLAEIDEKSRRTSGKPTRMWRRVQKICSSGLEPFIWREMRPIWKLYWARATFQIFWTSWSWLKVFLHTMRS